MWLVVMFDLPVTADARREYAHFRKGLLKDGFARMQFSVYIGMRQRGERGRSYARVEHTSPRRRGANHRHHRQAVRTHAHFLGKTAQPPDGPCPTRFSEPCLRHSFCAGVGSELV
jgi:hypothetical protein